MEPLFLLPRKFAPLLGEKWRHGGYRDGAAASGGGGGRGDSSAINTHKPTSPRKHYDDITTSCGHQQSVLVSDGLIQFVD